MLQVDKLTVPYGKLVAARDVSLSTESGEIVALFGHNGAGKTSVLRGMMGLIGSQGRVAVGDHELPRADPMAAFDAGLRLVPQSDRFFGNLTVSENLELAAVGTTSKKIDGELSAFVNDLFPRLRDRSAQHAGTLSGGEGQMLAVSMALMAKPRVLMLDEPSVGLAPLLVQRLMKAVKTTRDELGIGVLLVEQNIGQALSIADRVYVMQSGGVVFEGASAEIDVDSLWEMF